MNEEIRWKQRFDNFTLALHQLTLAVELSRQRTLYKKKCGQGCNHAELRIVR